MGEYGVMTTANNSSNDIDKIYECKLCQNDKISFGDFEDHLLNQHKVAMAVVVDNFAFVNSLFMLARHNQYSKPTQERKGE
jgi:hypothetical protein